MRMKAASQDPATKRELIQVAQGAMKADLVLRNSSLLDVFSGQFINGDVAIHKNYIVGICDDYEGEQDIDLTGCFLVPGFIDAHVHIESSLMIPSRFQQSVLPCGTTTAIWDPHEIANVKGKRGIEWALAAAKELLMDVFVMVPSCVPSTDPQFELETSGAILRAADIREFRDHQQVLGLAEMMNFPGLLTADGDILGKLEDYKNLLRDGHCPLLTGKQLNAYATAGIHSCHESTSLAEAREKLSKGIHVLVREGSCAKDAAELLPLIGQRSATTIAMCSDDRNPLDIAEQGHIDYSINLGLAKGIAPEDLFRAASFAPSRIFGLFDRGAIAPGYLADIAVITKNAATWQDGFAIKDVFKSGKLVTGGILAAAAAAPSKLETQLLSERNLNIKPIVKDRIALPVPLPTAPTLNVIGVIPEQIVTKHLKLPAKIGHEQIIADHNRDLLKIAVFERHQDTGFHSVAMVQGFGLKTGAIATSINHDSHNIIAVGASDEAIVAAVNQLIAIDGGIVVWVDEHESDNLPLPLGGLMTAAQPHDVAQKLKSLKAMTKRMGCQLAEPFLQLSFLALPVIPELKITDRGLVDVGMFAKIPLWTD